MANLTRIEEQVLLDVLDIEIASFKDAQEAEASQPASSWEELLSRTGGYSETIEVLQSIKDKVEDDRITA